MAKDSKNTKFFAKAKLDLKPEMVVKKGESLRLNDSSVPPCFLRRKKTREKSWLSSRNHVERQLDIEKSFD